MADNRTDRELLLEALARLGRIEREHGGALERIEHDHGKLLLELRTTQLGHDVKLREHGERLERIEANGEALDGRMAEVLKRVNDALPPDEPPEAAEAAG